MRGGSIAACGRDTHTAVVSAGAAARAELLAAPLQHADWRALDSAGWHSAGSLQRNCRGKVAGRQKLHATTSFTASLPVPIPEFAEPPTVLLITINPGFQHETLFPPDKLFDWLKFQCVKWSPCACSLSS